MDRGSQFYDQEHVFNNYMERRKWNENANDTIEKPIFMDLVADVTDYHILDLGCGTASFGNELLDSGARSYTGIEGSRNMVELSKEVMNRSNGTVIHTTMEEWEYPNACYNMVISRLAIHYINDIGVLFEQVYRSLLPGGSFIFSVEHPVLTSSYGNTKTEGWKQDWVVDHYFHNGARKQEWLGGTVTKYHRTIEDYFTAMQQSRFIIESLKESRPREEHFHNEETYKRRMRIPLFLFMKGKKL
ncbi:class I SAM-dependent methyltransferase [Paenibacillus sediminis]|uniref:Ubiquinone/menaquinone biosynthesis C-methylase UbiE n=1 Tax=Paenibacillus sediminis TaxID=664909 RepID=A0ABS4H2Q5_9BACL|nr:class I SAM-dependent methyltransferase [Paenibacillus sediminis]MBP1936547.1 ubiquinone/menaquinone biosynthesis C-methylase UbiE [Paenibacillus sediminis]